MRKQDDVERDMSAIRLKLNLHDDDAQKLLSTNPPLKESIYQRLQMLQDNWGQLADLSQKRRAKLVASLKCVVVFLQLHVSFVLN